MSVVLDIDFSVLCEKKLHGDTNPNTYLIAAQEH